MRRVDILNTTSPAGACIRPGRKLYGKRREEIRLPAGAWTGLAPRGSADGTPSFYVSVGEVRSAVGLIECCRGKAPPRSYRLPPHGRAAGRRGACQPAGASDLVSWPAPLRQESARNSAQDDRPLRLGPDCNPDPRPSDRISPRGASRQPPAAAYGSTASPRGWTPYAAGHHMRLDTICGAACRQTMRNCYRVSATAPFLAAAGPRRLPSNARIPTHAVPRDKLGGLREPGCHQTPCSRSIVGPRLGTMLYCGHFAAQ